MTGLFLLGSLLFIGTILIFKVMFFVMGVLFSGAGFLIKSIVLIILLTPLVPVLFILIGSFFSLSTLIFILLGGCIISLITERDRRYMK